MHFKIPAQNAGERRGMKMFGLFKKKQKRYEMTAAADGHVLPMSEASDEVFSSLALGDGVVIRPTGSVVVAPADGVVTVTMPESNHAIGMELEGGIEILIHIGVDTVNLKGEGFTPLVKAQEQVKAGTELIRFDREAMEAKGYCMEIMQIVMEGGTASMVQYEAGMEAHAGSTVVAHWQL